jgi:hypothetical protein
MSRDPSLSDALRERLAAVGRSLAEREAAHAAALGEARREAEALRRVVAEGLEAYHAAASGAEALRVTLGPVRPDDKHVRAVEFDLTRGRCRAIVTVKSRGEVTLVGPFKAGRTEGPCKTFPFDAGEELEKALGEFLEAFLHEAATP